MPPIVNQKKASSSPLWFAGLCDELYIKIALWDHAYWYGEVHSTRQYLSNEGKVIDKPTRCLHDIPFRQQELEHLIRILEALRPDTPLLDEIKSIQQIWRYGKAVHGYKYARSYWSRIVLPTGLHRVVSLAFYPEHVKELLQVLTEAKTGQKASTLANIVAEKKTEGKDLFEE